jgi:hypothetical protein
MSAPRILWRILPWGLVLLGETALRAQTTVQWMVGSGGNGHYYQLVAVPGGISWSAANTAAQNAGGYLATLTSSAENSFVYTNLASLNASVWFTDTSGNSEGPWLGGFQPNGSSEPSGGWSWVTGEAWSFTSWSPGEPNNFNPNEDYLQFFGAGSSINSNWNDAAGAVAVRGYLIEYDTSPIPEPADAALILAGIAGGLIAWRRRRIARARRNHPRSFPAAFSARNDA